MAGSLTDAAVVISNDGDQQVRRVRVLWRARPRDPHTRLMLIPLVVVCLVLLAVSVAALRRGDSRRLFLTFATLTAVLTCLTLAVVLGALLAGRDTWNSWVSGTPHRETLTLTVLVFGLPLLLGIAVLSLIVNARVHRRRRRPSS